MLKNYYNKVSIIDNNFLTSDECRDLVNTVLCLKEKWQSKLQYPYLNFLPFSLYSIGDNESYKNNVKLYNGLMYDHFGQLYTKLKLRLSAILGIELFYHEHLNYPGFHISNGQSMDSPNFHNDVFQELHKFFIGKEKLHYKNHKILSVICPLSIISDKDGLLYRNLGSQDIDRKNLSYDEFLPYTEGMLAIWDGNVQHSMNPFPEHACSNLRITLQCHIAIATKGYIFW